MSRAGTVAVAFRGRVGGFALDVAFTVPARGVTALFGPSGCGKTTALRAVAGLHRFPGGRCVVDGDLWQDERRFVPPHRRAVGYVFQEASLFPHLGVRANLLFGARGPVRPDEPHLGFDEVVDLLGLDSLLGRGPGHLSGGERQRVAIGRALLSRPRLLLMDEPLSALDGAARAEILPFIERLHTRLAIPVLYVSHDMGEVERLADTLVAMRAGRVEALGPLHELQSDPAPPFATGRDAAVTVEAEVEAYDAAYGLATFAARGLRLLVPTDPVAPGGRHRLRVAAADVSLALSVPAASTILNVLPVVISSVTPADAHAVLAVLEPPAGGPRLLARVTRLSWERLGLAAGQRAYAQIKSVALAPR